MYHPSALDLTLTAAPGPKKMSCKDAKNAQQYVNESLRLSWRLGGFARGTLSYRSVENSFGNRTC